MRNSYLIILLTLFGIVIQPRCNNGSTTVEKTDDTACKTLLIIAEDRSGSVSDHRKLTSEDYRRIFTAFQKHFNGQIAVRVIGNPAPKEREFYVLSIKPLKKFLKIKEDMLLSEKTLINEKNDKIKNENQAVRKSNLNNIDTFIKDKIQKHIIEYKSYKGKDVTDIEDALKHIQVKINEPTFRNYDNIQILIISDGKHDAFKLKEKLSLKADDKTTLYLIGWKDISVFDKISDKNQFDSVEGFMEYYDEIKCN